MQLKRRQPLKLKMHSGMSTRMEQLLLDWKCNFKDCIEDWEKLTAIVQKLEACASFVRRLARHQCRLEIKPVIPSEPNCECEPCQARRLLKKGKKWTT